MPVVALESTVISHGLPYPHNLETALALETAVREIGAIPATIAIFGGECLCRARSGTDQQLATRKDIRKDLPSDLSIAAGKKLNSCYNCCDNFVLCRPGRHSRLCNRWYRWRAPRLLSRCLSGSGRARKKADNGRLLGSEEGRFHHAGFKDKLARAR